MLLLWPGSSPGTGPTPRPGQRWAGEIPWLGLGKSCGAIMTRHFDQRAIERAAVILRIAGRYSGDGLDAALKAARRAIEICLKETCAGANVGCALFEAIDAARFVARNRA